MEKEFERIHTEISQRLKTDAIDKIIPHIPTDIRFYKPLCKYALSNDIDTSIILFLYVQSNAPFSINKILSKEDICKLIRKVYFVNSSKLKPYIIEIIANLIKEEFDRYHSLDEFRGELNNVVYKSNTLSIAENKEEIVDVKLENKLCNLHIKDNIDDETYYRILLHLSNTSRSDILSTIRLEKNDPIHILKLKSKILSKYIHTDVINNLVSFLNIKSTLLGFSLSKAIYKIILKSKNQDTIIAQLRNMADKIFAKEFLFINLAQIFAYSILRGMHIDVEDMILCMIKYNQYSVYNNEQVRETGLLLLWACIRAEIEFVKLDVLHEIILISLFDCSLNCRRAGSSVLVEYLGRCKIENANQLLRLINFDTVKRLATSLANIPEIMDIKPSIKTKVYDLCKQNILTFPVLNERYIFAQILKQFEKCFCRTKLEGRDTQNFRYGLSVYFNASKFCENCREDSKIQFLHEIDLKRMQSQKIFEPFLEVYMSTISILLTKFNLYNSTNIIYCLDKNYHPHHISNIVSKIDDRNIKEMVYKNFLRRQNDAYILSNSNNSCYYDGIAKIYLKILQGNDPIKKATVIKALEDFLDFGRFEYFEKEEMCKVIKEYARENAAYTSAIERYDIEHLLLFYMMLGLEDYTVYVKGDAGYFVRHNSIMALADVDYNISYRYFVRYLVDKSPKLRAGILSSFFSHFRHEAFVIEYDNHSEVLKNENTLSDEHIHFASAFKAYDSLNDDLKEEFLIGILATFRNGDSYTVKYIKQYLFGSYEKYMGIVERFLGYKKRYLFLALYFLDMLVVEKPETKGDVLQMLKIVRNDDKSDHLQNIIDNLQAKCLTIN